MLGCQCKHFFHNMFILMKGITDQQLKMKTHAWIYLFTLNKQFVPIKRALNNSISLFYQFIPTLFLRMYIEITVPKIMMMASHFIHRNREQQKAFPAKQLLFFFCTRSSKMLYHMYHPPLSIIFFGRNCLFVTLHCPAITAIWHYPVTEQRN